MEINVILRNAVYHYRYVESVALEQPKINMWWTLVAVANASNFTAVHKNIHANYDT